MPRKLTHEEFMEKFNTKNTHAKDIEILGTYKGALNKIKCRCKVCGYKWETTPNDLQKGHGCAKCGDKRMSQKLTRTHEEFMERLHQVNPNIEILGTYITSTTKIKVRCKIDGYEWEVKPTKLLNESGCPKCKITKGEKRIAQYLDDLGIAYIYNMGYFKDLVGVNGRLLRPDFIIPSMKIWIEYDGIQHFEPVNFKGAMNEQQIQELFEYTQQNDQIKNQYAKDNNWTLIRIPYWDIDNIEQILDAVIKQEEAI